MDCKPPPVQPLEMVIGTVFIAALVGLALCGGYAVGLKAAPIQFIDRAVYVDRLVKEPYEQLVEVPVLTPVPGPTVYVPVPGPTVIKRVSVPTPRYCPRSPSVAASLNEYEAIAIAKGARECPKF